MKRSNPWFGVLVLGLVALGCSDDANGVAGSGGSAGIGGNAGGAGSGGVGGAGGESVPAEFISFSGTLDSVTDSLGDDITSSIGMGVVDPVPTWLAAWDYSSTTPLAISSISFDSDTGEYDVSLYYESSSDARNIYGRQLQQVTGTTLEVSADGGTLTLEGVSSTFLKTASDSLVMRVHFSGSATDSFSEFRIDFFTPVASMTDAFTYDLDDVDDGVTIMTDTSTLDAFAASVDSAFDDSGLDEGEVDAIVDALVGEIDDAAAVAEATLLVADQDTYLSAITEIVDIANTLSIDDTSVFNFTLSDPTEQTLLLGDTGASAMTFSLDGLTFDSVVNTAFLELLSTLLSDNAGTTETRTFTPDVLTDDDLASLAELLTLSVEQGTNNVDTQGAFAVQLEVGGIATENLEGVVTGVSVAGE